MSETAPSSTEVKTSLGENYFNKRIVDELGISDKLNTVQLWVGSTETKWDEKLKNNVTSPVNILQPFKIFEPCDKGIAIRIFTLDRTQPRHADNEMTGDGQEVVKRGIKKDYRIIRLHTPRIDDKGKEHKYHIPKGAGTYPFIPPGLIDKYEKSEKIKTLVLTEGAIKTFVAWMHGLDIIGLTSISHYKDKETGGLHSDVIKLILKCQVENVIWLVDADANNISMNAFKNGEDLYKRPNFFFSSATAVKRLLDDYDVHKYFAYINPDLENNPKGIDDLLMAEKKSADDIVQDLLSLSRPARWFWREDMSYSTAKIRQHLRLDNVDAFVEYHSERIREASIKAGITDYTDLKKKEFVWNGTRYQWDESKSTCKVMIPAKAAEFFRVGDTYYKHVDIPNKYGEVEPTFHRRQKSTITDDHGKEFVQHIPKYEAFCNVPDHVNYQQIIHSCYNMYFPFEHEAKDDGDGCVHTMSFLEHIFGSGTVKVKHKELGELEVKEIDLGLDYIQLLYQKPQQVLPILCLVSKEQGTGKTTFVNWLKLIFTQNVAIVGNADLANDFNAHWAGKLLVVCEEAKIDKVVVVEKVKALSTGNKIYMNAKGKDQIEIDFFAKFIFNTNNEENFIYAGEDDVRYWVRKVPVIDKLFVGLLEMMKEEIPAFLDYLNKRKMATENLHRAWFYPELIKTEALKKVIQFSKSTVEKELRSIIRDMFFDHGVDKIYMTLDSIKDEFFKSKYEKNYLRQVIKDQMKIDYYHEFEWQGKEFKTMAEVKAAAGIAYNPALITKKYKTRRHAYPKFEPIRENNTVEKKRVYINDNGRPFVFLIEDFLLKAEIEGRWVDAEAVSDAYTNELSETIPGNQGGPAAAVQLELGATDAAEKKDDLPF